MSKASNALQKSVLTDAELMGAAEAEMATKVANAQYATRDARAELDTLEGQVANRRSLRSSQEVRMAQDVSAAQIAASDQTGHAGQQMARAKDLEVAQENLASQSLRNQLLNEADTRKLVAAEAQVNAIKQVESSQMAYAEQMAIDRRLTEQTAANAMERQRIAQKEAESRIASSQRMMASITSGGTMAVMAGAALVVSAAAVAGGFAYAADKAANFEKAVLLIKTQAGATRAEVDLMRQAVLTLAPQFGYTATEAATAAFHIESVGLRGSRAVDALKFAMEGARIGAADLEATTNMLAVIMASGLVPATQSSAETMATLDAIIGQGNIRMDQLAGAFRTGLIGAMQMAGVKLKDMGAALATLTDLGYSGATAGTALRSALTMIASPTAKATELLKIMGFSVETSKDALSKMTKSLLDAGINVTQFASVVRGQGLAAGLQMLHDKMKAGGLSADEMAATITKAFGGSRIGSAFKVLFENMARLQMREAAIAKNSTAAIFAQKWSDTQQLTTTKMSQLGSSFNTILILLGEALMPTVNRAIDAFIRFLTPIGDWISRNQELVAQLVPIVVMVLGITGGILILGGAFAVLGAMVAAVASAIGVFSGGLGAVLLIAGGLAAMLIGGVAIAMSAWGAFSSFWVTRVVPAATRVGNVISAVWKAITDGIATTKPIFDAAFKSFTDTLSKQGGLWDDMTGAFDRFSKDLLTFIKSSTFASLIATLSVGIPSAIKVTLDYLILMGDQAQMSFTLLLAAAAITRDGVANDQRQMQKDLKYFGGEINRQAQRSAADFLQIASDTAANFNGTYKKQWQDVYDQTMLMTGQLGDDGASHFEAAMTKLQKAGLKITATMKIEMKKQFVDIAGFAADGIILGLIANQNRIDAAFRKSALSAAAAAKAAARAKSPSQLTADEVGEPMGLGVIMGLERVTGPLNAAMAKLVTGASVAAPMPASTGASGVPILSVLQDIRDGIRQLVSDFQQPAVATAPSNGATQSGGPMPATNSTLASFAYAILQQAESNRRRGVSGYGMDL